MEREAAAKDAGAQTLAPSPESPETANTKLRAEMSDGEKATAKSMFPMHDDPVGKYLQRNAEIESGQRMVSVPLGGGKKG